MAGVGADLGELLARFKALAEHPGVGPDVLTTKVGQVCAQIARGTGSSVRVTKTEAGVTVRFWGPGASAARTALARRMGTVSAEVQASAAHVLIEELSP